MKKPVELSTVKTCYIENYEQNLKAEPPSLENMFNTKDYTARIVIDMASVASFEEAVVYMNSDKMNCVICKDNKGEWSPPLLIDFDTFKNIWEGQTASNVLIFS